MIHEEIVWGGCSIGGNWYRASPILEKIKNQYLPKHGGWSTVTQFPPYLVGAPEGIPVLTFARRWSFDLWSCVWNRNDRSKRHVKSNQLLATYNINIHTSNNCLVAKRETKKTEATTVMVNIIKCTQCCHNIVYHLWTCEYFTLKVSSVERITNHNIMFFEFPDLENYFPSPPPSPWPTFNKIS